MALVNVTLWGTRIKFMPIACALFRKNPLPSFQVYSYHSQQMAGEILNYRHLDSEKIIKTVETLKERIERRFPESGLSKVAAELLVVARETVHRTVWIQ